MGIALGSNEEMLRRIRQVRSRSADELAQSLKSRWSDLNEAYGLQRDLDVAFPAPDSRIALTVRPLEDRDVHRLLDPTAEGIDDGERQERRSRRAMLEAGLETAYVAATDDDEPAYVQWLLGPDQNDVVARHFRGIFPRSEPGEALLEGAFTPAAFRGQRVMPHAMARIAELGSTVGARIIRTFVTTTNVASLKGCQRSGFEPYVVRCIQWRAMRQTVTFSPLPQRGTDG